MTGKNCVRTAAMAASAKNVDCTSPAQEKKNKGKRKECHVHDHVVDKANAKAVARTAEACENAAQRYEGVGVDSQLGYQTAFLLQKKQQEEAKRAEEEARLEEERQKKALAALAAANRAKVEAAKAEKARQRHTPKNEMKSCGATTAFDSKGEYAFISVRQCGPLYEVSVMDNTGVMRVAAKETMTKGTFKCPVCSKQSCGEMVGRFVLAKKCSVCGETVA